ncbi:hypothetical protein [Pseudomonas syringae]|uniref:hypothetical protein n=1 Tax=Pseudomonas TaxID=286 RepID=UPI000CD136A5|nr:hypothetical protein [Pseudomonas syringae]MCF5028156.1 hypothetical protein [Pseudomonas syringae]POD20212.1 hypothetical protein BKM12_09990 [Pseudomonas syringae pv. syringae]UQB21086.1 hypothetical protein I9H08_04415 [Pseudomonas syringae pv. syringae]
MTGTSTSDSDERRKLLLGVLLIVMSGVIAGAIFPLTQALAGFQDGDGILTSLMSTQKLTWYFWGQDRLLNFIPALASPFTDVETNLRVQVFFRSLFAYLSPLGILIFFNRSPKFLLVAIAITNVILLACLSQYAHFNFYVQHNTFGTSLVMLAFAYALTYSKLPKPVIAAIALFVCSVAYATNYALLTYAIPAIFLLGVLRWPSWKRYLSFFVINCLAVLIARYHSQTYGVAPTELGLLISLQAVIDALHVIYQNLKLGAFLLFLAITFVCYQISAEKKFLELSGVLCVAFAIVVLLANTLWVQMNLHNIRYFLTSELIIASVFGFVITRTLMLGRYKYALLIPGLALVYCVFFPLGGFTATYKELVGAPWRSNSSAVANVAVKEKAEVIAGAFWDVWPAVFETKHLQPDLPVYGAAFRGGVLRDDFLATTKGKGEFTALCFFDTTELCVNEIVGNFGVTGDNQLVVKKAEPIVVGEKKLLKMVLEVN